MDELIELEQRINHKIAQTKDKMHRTIERIVTDRLWPEVETLNWVLNEILVLRQRDEAFYSNPEIYRNINLYFYFPLFVILRHCYRLLVNAYSNHIVPK